LKTQPQIAETTIPIFKEIMFYNETKWLDDETLKLINRREKIMNELEKIEMKLDIIKGVSCQPIQIQDK